MIVGPVSGAHLNPAVSLADWLLGRRHRTGLTLIQLVGYVAAQGTGAIAGAVLANVMFDLPAVQRSTQDRAFVGAQLVGALAGAAIFLALYPGVGRAADRVVVTR